jgi:hypothetical protein
MGVPCAHANPALERSSELEKESDIFIQQIGRRPNVLHEFVVSPTSSMGPGFAPWQSTPAHLLGGELFFLAFREFKPFLRAVPFGILGIYGLIV